MVCEEVGWKTMFLSNVYRGPTCRVNTIGPRTLPLGTPMSRATGEFSSPATETRCKRPLNYERSHCKAAQSTLYRI